MQQKNQKRMIIDFIRHGMTAGNLEKRYIGITEEALCEQGLPDVYALKRILNQNAFQNEILKRQQGACQSCRATTCTHAECHSEQLEQNSQKRLLVISSPMQRCLQTADILYPGQPRLICEAFRECDFGDFENKNYLELSGNPAYQNWIDSGGTACFPNGTSPETFKKRVTEAFASIMTAIANTTENQIACMPEITHIAAIVHGGTIMAILEKFAVPQRNYYDYQLPNACAYRTCYADGQLQVLTKITPKSEINC